MAALTCEHAVSPAPADKQGKGRSPLRGRCVIPTFGWPGRTGQFLRGRAARLGLDGFARDAPPEFHFWVVSLWHPGFFRVFPAETA